jgi:hypothetical protein
MPPPSVRSDDLLVTGAAADEADPEASVDEPDGLMRNLVSPAAGGEQKLRDLVREYKSSGPAFRFKVHTYLRASYASHFRRMVPHLLQSLEFCSNNATAVD